MPSAEEPAPAAPDDGAAVPVEEPRGFGPLELVRYRKDDGRMLILFARPPDPDGAE